MALKDHKTGILEKLLNFVMLMIRTTKKTYNKIWNNYKRMIQQNNKKWFFRVTK